METVTCLCCGSNNEKVLLVNHKDDGKICLRNLADSEKPTRFVICSSCGFVYQNPRIEAGRLAEMYKKAYRTVPPEKHNPPDIQMQAEWIMHMIGAGGMGKEMLDIGCGTGSLLNIFKKMFRIYL